MDLLDTPLEFGDRFKGELVNSKKCLEELRKINDRETSLHQGEHELFDPGLALGFSTARTTDEKIKAIGVACIWHSILLKIGFKFKLLHLTNGYLDAVSSKNPISILLLARYCLELIATINFIASELEKCHDIPVEEWERRGFSFLAVLYRARHSSSDPNVTSTLIEWGLPDFATRPIRINKAIQQLTSRHGFSTAASLYAYLSNLCHHNGSGTLIFADRARMTDAVATKSGRAIFLDKKMTAVTYSFPASRAVTQSLAQTARLVWWSVKNAHAIVDEMIEVPYTDIEMQTLTKGRIKALTINLTPSAAERRSERSERPRRNSLCPCNSGKKYKFCCLGKADDFSSSPPKSPLKSVLGKS